MLFKPELAAKILAGEKTQTRRLVKRGDYCDWPLEKDFVPGKAAVLESSGRKRWQIGKTYAICPGRGKKQIGRIRITNITSEVVAQISEEDARKEGFKDKKEFEWAFWYINPKSQGNTAVWVLDFELVKEAT